MPFANLDIWYIRPRPSRARFHKVLAEILPAQSQVLHNALIKHVGSKDWTLTETEISKAANPKWPTRPNPGAMRLLYGKFGHALSDKLGISDRSLLFSRIDDNGDLWRGPASQDSAVAKVRDNWTRGFAAMSRDEKGEVQWTLFPEVANALLAPLRLKKLGPLAGDRLPSWAMNEIGIEVGEAGTQPTNPPVATEEQKPDTFGGAGFGDPVSNKEIEAAAIAEVRKKYGEKQYHVKSVEGKRGIGYDLICRKGREILHVEVKGIRGMDWQFFLTKSEKAAASKGGAWRIAVVRDALGAKHVYEYTGPDFLRQFGFVESGYWVKKKRARVRKLETATGSN